MSWSRQFRWVTADGARDQLSRQSDRLVLATAVDYLGGRAGELSGPPPL